MASGPSRRAQSPDPDQLVLVQGQRAPDNTTATGRTWRKGTQRGKGPWQCERGRAVPATSRTPPPPQPTCWHLSKSRYKQHCTLHTLHSVLSKSSIRTRINCYLDPILKAYCKPLSNMCTLESVCKYFRGDYFQCNLR